MRLARFEFHTWIVCTFACVIWLSCDSQDSPDELPSLVGDKSEQALQYCKKSVALNKISLNAEFLTGFIKCASRETESGESLAPLIEMTDTMGQPGLQKVIDFLFLLRGVVSRLENPIRTGFDPCICQRLLGP